MNKVKAKVISSEVGKFDVDSITVNINGEILNICFSKDKNVIQYDNKDVLIINDNSVFDIEEYVEKTANYKK